MPTLKEDNVTVDAEELNQLRKAVLTGMHQAVDAERRRELFKILCKIAPDPVCEQVQDLIDRNFENIDELNRQMSESVKKRNAATDPELGGLSLDQVSRLIFLDWDDNNFPLSFDKILPEKTLIIYLFLLML